MIVPGRSLLALLAATLSFSPTAYCVKGLSDDDLRNIPSPGGDFDIHDGMILAPILINRPPGSEGNRKTQRHFAEFFQTNLPEWTLIWQNSTSKTPATGDEDVPFSNLIFRRDPPGAQVGDFSRLTLVAHFDSLRLPEGFVGAIDSAAPCAMLMHVARSIDAALTAKWATDGDTDDVDDRQGIQIIFLDGEEAFLSWTDADSIYGARSLAAEWESAYHPAMSTFRTELDAISMFVLLDLLGGPPQYTVPSYFLTTHWAYENMAGLEKRMRDLKLMESKVLKPLLPDAGKTANDFYRPGIGDDHVPFLKRGVDILHLIPSPFPDDVWHKIEDDGEHLDLPTTRDWAKLMTAFAAEWMDLAGYLPQKTSTARGRTETEGVNSRRTEL